jgi:hypothetical protein
VSSDESSTKRQIILWSIGLSILIIALTTITFILMFPAELEVTAKSEEDFNKDIPGLNTPFPTTGNHCSSDYRTYAEIQNPDANNGTGAGWIHYADPIGNQTDIEAFLMKYCGMDKSTIEMFRGLSLT